MIQVGISSAICPFFPSKKELQVIIKLLKKPVKIIFIHKKILSNFLLELKSLLYFVCTACIENSFLNFDYAMFDLKIFNSFVE